MLTQGCHALWKTGKTPEFGIAFQVSGKTPEFEIKA